MPKKNSSNAPAAALSNSSMKVVDEASPTPKKIGLEMDEICSIKKRKKSEQEKAEKRAVTKKPKKSTNKTPLLEKPMVEEDGPTPTTKKPGNEIDEIFLIKKRKKAEQVELEKQLGDVASKANKTKKKKKKKEPKEKEFEDPPGRPRKRIGDGLTVYTEEKLGFGKADCPFDCDCCF